MEQGYFVVENNVVTNNIVWDGNPNTWTPPEGATMLVILTTPAKLWGANYNTTPYSWQLVEKMGEGDIGFTWDGSVLITNEPEPTNPPKLAASSADQPNSSGTQPA